MQLRYVFSELGQGLRRNLSMHIAVVLTLFVSLTLVGFGVLMREQSIKTTDQWGSELQITVYLCKASDDSASCTGEVTEAQKDAIEKVMDDSPEVADWRLESKEEAFEKVKELLGPDNFEGPNPVMTAEDMPEAYWITLNDPDEYQGIESAVVGLDGVSRIQDLREEIAPILRAMTAMRWGSIGIAIALVVAAVLLVGNTIRLTAFARRREIGIMRLVGASRLYITLPFLLEALVTAAISLALSLGALAAFMYFGVDRWLSEQLGFIPWVDWSDTTTTVAVVAILAPALTLLPTLAVTRKYLKV